MEKPTETMSERMQAAIAKALEEMFESVALTRRAHFERGASPRPTARDVEKIIKGYANQNFLLTGGINLVPGPFGALVVLPEITLVLRNQVQMTYDLGVAYGKEPMLDAKLLLAIFATVAGGGAVGLASVKGGQFVVRRASLRVIQKIIQRLGGKITQAALKSILAKWVPVVGAGAMAIWARTATVSMGRRAAELLRGEIVEEDGDAT